VRSLGSLFERTVYGRLKVEQWIESHPDIISQPIKQPLFIIGMPRTGTTILHALLNEDPENRSPLAWECLLPYPVPSPSNYNNNSQIRATRKEFNQLFKLVPDFKKKHYLEADAPQECIGIFALDFNSFQTSAQFYIPSYLEWFSKESDQLESMKWHKRFLQYLGSGGVTGARWLLKTPVHLMRLEELFSVYPDACVIMTHRDPKKVIPSATSLISSVRSLYSDHEDPAISGHEQNTLWSSYFESSIRSRNKINKEGQIIDIRFEEFVQGQIKVVEKIYDHFNWTLSDVAKSRMQNFLDNNPKGKHGEHLYALQDFNLTENQIEETFKGYYKFLDRLES